MSPIDCPMPTDCLIKAFAPHEKFEKMFDGTFLHIGGSPEPLRRAVVKIVTDGETLRWSRP